MHRGAQRSRAAGQQGGTGQNALLVEQVALGHGDGGRGRRIEGGTGFQQADDLGTTITGALDDLVQFFLCGPAHLDQIRQRDTGNGGIAG